MSETPIPNDHTSKPGPDVDSTPLDRMPSELTDAERDAANRTE